jgi:hypothetical protein
MRPLNLGETLDASIKVVRRSWRTLAAVMIVIALPIQLFDLLIISSTTDTYQVGSSAFDTSAATHTTYSDRGAYVAGQLVIQVLSLIGYLLGTVACYRAIVDTYLGRPTSARESLRFAAERLGATLWLSILVVVGVIAGTLAFVVPGIWLMIAWSVAIPAMLVEGKRGAKALGRSLELVRGRWWATLGRLLVAYILVSVVTAAASFALLLPALVIVDDTSFGALVLEHAANLLVSLVTTPFIAAVTTLVYFDLRVRKEGFDLAVLAERMGGAPAAGPAPERRGGPERDAFGHPVAPAAPSAPSTPPPAPGQWAPPVAPEPQPPPSPGS